MVCRDPQTLNLLEATQEVKARFQEQASRADLFFIVGGLDILNKADVQFRGSQNQRLLVELALMQVCSQEALKKKSTDGSYGLMAPRPQAEIQRPIDAAPVQAPATAVTRATASPETSIPTEPSVAPQPAPEPEVALSPPVPASLAKEEAVPSPQPTPVPQPAVFHKASGLEGEEGGGEAGGRHSREGARSAGFGHVFRGH